MGMISHLLNQTCELVTTSHNKYGEQTYESSEEIACKFREITEVSKFSNREDIQADALLWVEPETDINRGSIVKVEDQYYRVERLTKARKNTETVQFIKCLLEKHKEVS